MKNKHYVLCSYSDTYNDEFDMQGYVAREMSEEDYDEFMANFNALRQASPFSLNIGVGTNQQIHYDSSGDFIAMVKVKEITKEQYDVLVCLGFDEFGFTKFMDIIDDALYYICYDGDVDDEF